MSLGLQRLRGLSHVARSRQGAGCGGLALPPTCKHREYAASVTGKDGFERYLVRAPPNNNAQKTLLACILLKIWSAKGQQLK